MFRKHFLRALYALPVAVAAMLYAAALFKPNYLIAPPEIGSFEDRFEEAFVFFLFPLYTFILTNPYEIELGLVNGCSTVKLAAAKTVPIFVYSIIPAFAAVAFYRYVPLDVTGYDSKIEIYVPDNYRIYMFISVFVTVLFFSSVYFFFRILLKNCFIPIIVDLVVWMTFMPISSPIRMGERDVRWSLIDPFITRYFVGDTVPNRIAGANPGLSLMRNAWTVNRVAFFTASLILIAATVFLLSREKMHRGLAAG